MSNSSSTSDLATEVGKDVKSLRSKSAPIAPAQLPRFKAKRAAAVVGSGLCRVAFLGDSITAGYPSFQATGSWPIRARNLMQAAGYPIAGSGFVKVVDGPNSTFDPRWTFTNAWVASDTWSSDPKQAFPHAATFTTGATATCYPSETGTVVNVLYAHFGQPFSVSIDGGTAVTVTPNGGETMGIYTRSGLTNIRHSVKITALNANGTYATAVEVRQENGVVFDNWGYTSSEAAWFVTDSVYNYVDHIKITAPDLVVMCWGLNEVATKTGAQYQATLEKIAARFPNADKLLCKPIPIDYYLPETSAAATKPFRDAVDRASLTIDAPIFDFYSRWGGSSTFQATLGLIQNDKLHPTAPGYADMGSGFSKVLLA